MLDKLEAMMARLSELERQLAEPEVLRSPQRMKELGQEYAELRPVVEAYGRFKKVAAQLEQAHELAREGDPEMTALAREEIKALEPESTRLDEELKLLLIPKDPLDGKNIILEIRAGTGGEEAALFARELYEMYHRFAERKGWKTEVMSLSAAEQGGVKEIIALIAGKGVYGRLRYESGVHRVQRVPVTEAQGRIHTSAVTVAVMAEAEDIELNIDEGDLKIDVFRSQGAGGQSVNTTDSAVRITHKPTGMVVTCQDERSQHKNKSKAMKILRSRLLDLERSRQDSERAALRKGMVGSGDRSEKIRTYNFPQNRMTDHRINLTLYKLERIMLGDLDDVMDAISSSFRAQQLAGLEPVGGRAPAPAPSR
jgi:peptide chain release factor 1